MPACLSEGAFTDHIAIVIMRDHLAGDIGVLIEATDLIAAGSTTTSRMTIENVTNVVIGHLTSWAVTEVKHEVIGCTGQLIIDGITRESTS